MISYIVKKKRTLLLIATFCVVGIFLLPSKTKTINDHYVSVNAANMPEIVSATITPGIPALATSSIHSLSGKLNPTTTSKMTTDAITESSPETSDHKTINAVELFDDGHVNLSRIDKDMLKGGRLFANDLIHLRELKGGDNLEIRMPNVTAPGVMKTNTVDDNGNNTIVVDFQEQSRGYLILYKAANAETFHGEIFINGQHFKYMANADVGVIVDMKKFITWPMD